MMGNFWKLIPLVAMMVVGCHSATAQTDKTQTKQQATEAKVDDAVFVVVEENPEFEGGMPALYQYLSQNIHYPKEARENHIQGKVFVSFVIEKDGTVSNAKVLRKIGGGCDEEALRVVQAMPKWKPGRQQGKPVRVQFNLPINFQLNEE